MVIVNVTQITISVSFRVIFGQETPHSGQKCRLKLITL
jgi:hypothetical protein